MNVGETLCLWRRHGFLGGLHFVPAVYSSHSSQRGPVVFVYKVMSLFWEKPSKGFLSHLELNFNPLSIPYSKCRFPGLLYSLSTYHWMQSSHWPLCCSSSMLLLGALAFAVPFACSSHCPNTKYPHGWALHIILASAQIYLFKETFSDEISSIPTLSFSICFIFIYSTIYSLIL